MAKFTEKELPKDHPIFSGRPIVFSPESRKELNRVLAESEEVEDSAAQAGPETETEPEPSE